jgi:large repetitive protein
VDFAGDAAPLMAATSSSAAGGSGATLTQDALAPLVTEAFRRWAQSGILSSVELASLSRVVVSVGSLDGGLLGLTRGQRITLDSNAAGSGWFIDRTPGDDVEFAGTGVPGELRTRAGVAGADRIDLLTVLMHEMGHAAGLEHTPGGVATSALMRPSLEAGTRELPGMGKGTAGPLAGPRAAAETPVKSQQAPRPAKGSGGAVPSLAKLLSGPQAGAYLASFTAPSTGGAWGFSSLPGSTEHSPAGRDARVGEEQGVLKQIRIRLDIFEHRDPSPFDVKGQKKDEGSQDSD